MKDYKLHLSESHKKNISRAQKGKKNHFYGKHHSEETKEKLKHHPTNKAVLCVETGVVYASMKEAERQTKISSKKIGDVCNGRRKTTGGLHWQFTC